MSNPYQDGKIIIDSIKHQQSISNKIYNRINDTENNVNINTIGNISANRNNKIQFGHTNKSSTIIQQLQQQQQQQQQQNLPQQSQNQSTVTLLLNEKLNSSTKNISTKTNIDSIQKRNKDRLNQCNLSSLNYRTGLEAETTTTNNNDNHILKNDKKTIKKNSIMLKSDNTNNIIKMGEAGVNGDGRKIIDSTITPPIDKNIKRISRQNSNASSTQHKQKPSAIMQQRQRQQQSQQQQHQRQNSPSNRQQQSQHQQQQQQQLSQRHQQQQQPRQRHKSTSSTDKIQQQQQQKGCENYYSSQSTMHSSRGDIGNVRGGDIRGRPTTTIHRRKRTVSDTTGNRGKQQRRHQISSDSSSSSSSDSSTCSGSCCDDGDTSSTSSGEPNLPYPGFPAIALKYFTQDSSPRNLCLRLITNPCQYRSDNFVILLNCITLGMYQPCVDDACNTNRCKILQMFDDIIFAFFALEMVIKIIAMGLYGKNTYLADSWNRLDCFIVFAGLLEYLMHIENLNLTAIRTIRVLRPLRAINRIPSMRILVMLLLDTLPMLGNVLLLCFFVFFIFGIVGVQLWEGILRQRCVLDLPPNVEQPNISFYYEFSKEQDYICTKPEDSGMHLCSNFPPYRIGPLVCNASAIEPLSNNTCINWNQYYTNCTRLGDNPFQGTISFDNIFLAWVAIFLVISLEGWTDIMYYVQDAHSFWDWIYFVLLIVIGSFFMINLCLVVIATQFSETKKREMERMRQERARYTSNSTLASSTNNSEPATCYAEIVKYIAHLWRRFKRRLLKKYRLYKCQRQQKEGLLPNADNLTFSPSRIKCHHPKCPKANRKPSNIQDQLITVMVPLNSNNNLQAAAAAVSQQQNLNLITNNNATSNLTHHNNNNLSVTATPQSVGTISSCGGGISILNSGSNASFTGVLIGSTSGTIHNNNNNMNNSTHNNSGSGSNEHNSSPDISEMSLDTISRNSNLKKTSNQFKDDNSINSQKTILLKIPTGTDSEQLIPACASGFLSPPTSARRRSSVMFNEYVILHTPPTIPEPTQDKNVCSSEKMTQAGDGTIWQVNLPQTLGTHNLGTTFTECSELSLHDALTCQELLAFSVAFSAALPTGNSTLESFYTSINQHTNQPHNRNDSNTGNVIRTSSSNNCIEDYSCCYDLYQNALSPQDEHNNSKLKKHNRCSIVIIAIYRIISKIFQFIRKYDKKIVEHKYFQQGILLAILINTLSMGIEYHNQPEELTAIVETSNIVFSAIFAVEMLLKVIAEGPFRYVANGFNVFDGIIVILSGIEIIQTFWGDGSNKGSSGLSVLRTFRLLRILKLVRFMPNLRRQLFVMLRTMDNVAVFFSLLVLFIFIFSILGMNLFGCKFCEENKGERKCDRKNFDSLLWALVTVFQILTQEDWNVVLFNGMEKTSHWAALYFVALMTFGNYVLFNLLVAILVEGFSSERNERREREQRELVKKLREENMAENFSDILCDELRSTTDSSSTNESYYEIRNKWHSAEELRKLNDAIESQQLHQQDKQHQIITSTLDPKCNIQKQRLLQPNLDYQVNNDTTNKISDKDLYKLNDDDRKILKKTYSIKERRSESSKLANLRPLREPPIIMTTAATPQDSPNTTLESGTTFRNWSQQQLELIDGNNDDKFLKSHSSPALLKPPTTLIGQKILDVERLPSFELIPPSPQMEHKTFNIINNNSINNNQQQLNLESNNSISNLDISNITNKNIIIPLQQSQYQNQQHEQQKLRSDSTTITITPSIPLTLTKYIDGDNLDNQQQQQLAILNKHQNINEMHRSSSFKVFRRSSSKKNKTKQKLNCNGNGSGGGGGDNNDDEQIILNNGRDNSHLISTNDNLLKRNDSFLRSANRIQNDTKDTNKLSPQNSIRRISSVSETGGTTGGGGGGGIGSNSNTSGGIGLTNISISRRSSCIYNNSQFYQNLNRHNSIKNYSSRRMSSIELALGKSSNLNVYNMENRKSMAFSNSKIDLDKWQKSLSNLNEPDTTSLQQHHQQHDEVKIISHEQRTHSMSQQTEHVSKIKILIERLKPTRFTDERETYSLYIFPEENRFREICSWFVNQKWFDNVVLLFIGLNCITLAMERPNIPPTSTERYFLATANYVFTVVFTLEMFIKVVAAGMFYGHDAYFTSGWNIMDGSLVIISIIDLLMSLISESSPRIFGILRVFRLLRSLRPLRVINRAPGLKLVVQTLLSSLRPIGNIVLICCTFFIIFGILGVQLFKGSFYYCEGEHIKGVRNKTDCLSIEGNVWINRKYNFDDLGKALMSLFVLSSRDGWVNIMYTGLDAVGVDQQPIVNYNEWRLLYFIAFILLVGFFVLNMFVGVVVENFHRCREEQEKEEKIRRAAKRALQMEKKRRKMHEPPYYSKYSPTRMLVHNVVTSKYFDLAIAAVIGLNVVTMALEYYKMPVELEYALKIFNYFFTAVFILEAIMKVVALGIRLYMKDKWNQLDVGIVILSIVGIVLEELETNIIPINPTIIRVMRVLRIARVLKLLKMAKGIRALLDTVMQALPQVGNLGLLFFLLFFIFAALGVELFGRLECSEQIPCQGLGEHAHFANFGMAFLTLFRVATGDNWNGIMKDTLRDDCDDSADCVQNCCVSTIIAPIFFVIFVLMAQFVLVNVVVAVLMKHLEESHKQMEDEIDMDTELERELVREQEFEEEQALCLQLQKQDANKKRPLEKVLSLPSNFTYSTPSLDKKLFNTQRRQTIQYFNQTLGLNEMDGSSNSNCGGSGGGGGGGVGVGIGGNSGGTSVGCDIGSIISGSISNQQQQQPLKSSSSKLGTTILGGNTSNISNDKKNINLISDKKQNENNNNLNDIFAAAAAAGGSEQLLNTARRMSRQEYNLPRLGGLNRRSSIIRAKMLQREQSLDEHGVRKRRLEKKRMSCDHLPWVSVSSGGGGIGTEKRGTIFESTEGETSCGGGSINDNDYPNELLDIQSIKSDDCTGRKKMLHSKLRTVSVDEKCLNSYYPGITDISPLPSTSGIKDTKQYPTTIQQQQQQQQQQQSLTTTIPITTSSTTTATTERNKQFGRSLSTDHGQLGAPPRFLSVPTRSMPPRSRSGSTKQLFKQQAVDEDPDIDESSLLLPTSPQKPQILHIDKSTSGLCSGNIVNSPTDKHQDGLSKSDSAEILRIISERRLMEHRDNSGNEDSDYNELLLVKSPHSSMEA